MPVGWKKQPKAQPRKVQKFEIKERTPVKKCESKSLENGLESGIEALTLGTPKLLGIPKPLKRYRQELYSCKKHFALSVNGFYAVPDCAPSGNLKKKYVIIQRHLFTPRKVSIFFKAMEKRRPQN